MAHLTAVCQYPLIKKIGKDSVVIMKVSQAEDINKRFISMKDTINYVNQNFETLINKHNFYIIKYTDSLSKINDSIRNLLRQNILLGGQASWYKKEFYDTQQNTYKYLSDVSISMKILIGIVAALTALVVIINN